jgi:hypothetical protein
MSAERQPNTSASPQQVYAYLSAFWKMHLTVEDPDLPQLRDLHRALCNQESEICAYALDLCLQNLLERLQQARSFGLQLPIPAWATAELDTLTEPTEDEAQS